MKNTVSKIILMALAVGSGPVAHAQVFDNLNTLEAFRKTTASGTLNHQIEIDNDSLLLRRDDGFYSSGLRYTHSFALRDGSVLRIAGWRLGQELYTASDIKLRPEQIDSLDHPYAAWLYGGVFSHTYRADGSHTNFGIDAGCLGHCAGGEWSQNSLHKLFNQPLPKGWGAQVRNEVGLVLYGDVAPIRWPATPTIDVAPRAFWRFGNIFTDAGAGLTLRIGRLNRLPDDPAWFGFMRVDGRAVAYNATLEGGYFSDNNLHTVKPERLVGEAEIGVVWQQGRYGLRASIVRRGNEISGLSDAGGRQSFARLQFTYSP